MSEEAQTQLRINALEPSYAYARNDTVAGRDDLGLMATPPKPKKKLPDPHTPSATKVMKVSRCHIQAFWGHWYFEGGANAGKGIEQIRVVLPQNDNDVGCAYGTVLGCYASKIPNEIPLPGYTPASGTIDIVNLLLRDSAENETQWDHGERIREAALEAAKSICKQKDTCCCKTVKFSWTKLTSGDPTEPIAALPNPTKGFAYDCEKKTVTDQ